MAVRTRQPNPKVAQRKIAFQPTVWSLQIQFSVQSLLRTALPVLLRPLLCHSPPKYHQ